MTRQTRGGDGRATHTESGNSLLSRLATHPLREELIDEVHARPSPLVSSPIRVSHMVFLDDERGQDDDADSLRHDEAKQQTECRKTEQQDDDLPDLDSHVEREQ